jgi:hypothetical protein
MCFPLVFSVRSSELEAAAKAAAGLVDGARSALEDTTGLTLTDGEGFP